MKIVRIENSKHVQERVLIYLEEGDPLRITAHELCIRVWTCPRRLWYNYKMPAAVPRAGLPLPAWPRAACSPARS